MSAPTCPTCGRTAPSGTRNCPWDGSLLRVVSAEEAEPSVVISPELQAIPGIELTTGADTPVDALIGTSIGDFVVRHRIGHGGMGIVYAGEQPVIGKRVAIKVIRPEYAGDRLQMERLLAEARAVNAIGHRGIIDIFNFGQIADGRHYVVMEHLDGRSLDLELARRGPLPAPEFLDVLDEMLAALGAGHGAGIIHRDLKPSNVFLVTQPDGTRYVKLLDFGLAKKGAVPHRATPQTRQDVFVGTPEYIAPEQARAEAVGPWTDLYSAGVVAFELLTGRLPFDANAPIEWVMKHLEARPPAPSSVHPGVPPELDRLVLRLMEKDPAQRPASADEVRREIARIKTVLTTTEVEVLPPKKTLRRSRAPLVIAGAVALAALLGAGLWAIL